MRKGLSQIDLAIGVAFIVFAIGLGIAFTSRELAAPVSTAQAFESRASAEALSEAVYGDRGTPTNWQNLEDDKFIIRPSLGEFIYRTKIRVKETGGTNQNNKVVKILMSPEGKGDNTTFIAYDGSTPLATSIEGSGEFPTDVNVSFRVSVDANSEKLIFIYYSNDSSVDFSYSSLTESTHNLTLTTLSEEKFIGIGPTKLSKLNETLTISEFRDRMALKENFRLEVENTTTWAYGQPLPDNEELFISRKNLVFQNSTGHINSVQGRVYLW